MVNDESWLNPRRVLTDLGVRVDAPGFYDDPAFLSAEKDDPSFLEIYASFVRHQRYRTDYLSHAEQVIQHAVEFMRTRLDAEKQLGRCIDCSLVLMRFLERQGVWCYAVKGALTLIYGKSTGLSRTHFAPMTMPGIRIGRMKTVR